jgi:hypothetical protein
MAASMSRMLFSIALASEDALPVSLAEVSICAVIPVSVVSEESVPVALLLVVDSVGVALLRRVCEEFLVVSSVSVEGKLTFIEHPESVTSITAAAAVPNKRDDRIELFTLGWLDTLQVSLL